MEDPAQTGHGKYSPGTGRFFYTFDFNPPGKFRMDIYSKKDRWKIYLGIGGALIIAISLFYTNYLAQKLGQEERRKVESWVLAQEQLNDTTKNLTDLTLHLQVLESNKTIPVILVNDRGGIDFAANFPNGLDTSETFLLEEVEKLQSGGFQPIQGFAYQVYYKESTLLRQLRFFPFIQLLLIAGFVFLGYLGFSSARRAEQNRVWVGMAKETAHQLGTPISAIVAWIDHLRESRAEDVEVQEVLNELGNDVKRLELIAERFSKIGSLPALETVSVSRELDKARAYMQRRAPRKVVFDFPDPDEQAAPALMNAPLFAWVIENLLRNALDAMGSEGTIRARIYDENHFTCLDLSDTGKGIPAGKFQTVFKPGFTTKKRGWGLGLSLAKRIIEEYHHGKIFVKSSEEGKGTTFCIKLPKAPAMPDAQPKPQAMRS